MLHLELQAFAVSFQFTVTSISWLLAAITPPGEVQQRKQEAEFQKRLGRQEGQG